LLLLLLFMNTYKNFLLGNLKVRDVGLHKRIILKLILKKQGLRM